MFFHHPTPHHPTTPHQSHPDIVILATSILSTASVLAALPVARLKRSTLVVDVLSVKEFPKRALLARLPPSFDILCTHPMFGPDSGSGAWDGLAFVYDKVRVGKSPSRTRRADALLTFFRSQGCRMVEMACEEHDRLAAGTQFLTHTVGRVLGGMGVEETVIDTRGYQSLLSLVANTANDSFDLYYGLFMYNPVSFFGGVGGSGVGKHKRELVFLHHLTLSPHRPPERGRRTGTLGTCHRGRQGRPAEAAARRAACRNVWLHPAAGVARDSRRRRHTLRQ